MIDEINARGGLPFIQASTHTKNDGTPIVKGSRWEGKGMESNFIKVLAKSYEKVSKELGKYVGPEQEIIEEQPAEPEQPREKKFTYEGKTIETEFPLGIEQEAALKKLIDFVKKGNTLNAMTLQGAAGTGKTAVIGYLQKFLGNRYTFAYMAPTHAATAELGFATAKTGSHQLPATVASSLTFNPVKGNVFSQKISKRLGLNPVIVVDESSMLDNEDIKKLVEATNDAGGRIIFLGDEKQIPKVTKGEDMDDMELLLTGGSSTKNVSPVFTKFDKAVMTKIFRQSNNSLLSLLAAVREQTDFKLFRVPNSNSVKFLNKREYNQELEKDIETDAENTVVVAYTNDAVKGENKKIRSTLGRTGETVVGDILMGYLGYATKQIEKGDVANSISYTLTGIDKEGSTVNLTMKSDKLVRLQKLGIQGIPSTATTTYYQMSKDDSLTFDHLTDKDFENNNKDISSIFARIHQANQDYAAKKITYATYLGLIAGYGDTLRRYSVGDRYVYNPSTKRMEKFDKKKHKGIKTTGNGTLLFEKDIDYGHAITIHKSQGATIDNVYFDTTSLTIARNTPIIDNKGNRITTERQSLVYVAMSRSKKKLVVYMGDNDFELLGSQQKQQPKAPPESDDQFPPDITFFSSDDIEPPGYPPINPRC